MPPGDAVISGTLTRIDPVANDSGSFGATVTVNGQDSGLLIGISAKVEIVISEKDDVFTRPPPMPWGTNEDGTHLCAAQDRRRGHRYDL